MSKRKHIALLLSECLTGLGLKAILTDFFGIDHVLIFSECEQFLHENESGNFDIVFIFPETYILYNDQFSGIKNRLIILTRNESSPLFQTHSLATVDITKTQEEIVNQLEKLFASKLKQKVEDNQESLSIREIEVLKLVASGYINKQIADNLYISSHTVISHRKNITRKLGINTVSGLTVYALINGLITADDLQDLSPL